MAVQKDNSDTQKLNSEDIPYRMLSLDPFSKWLGIEILEVAKGRVK